MELQLNTPVWRNGRRDGLKIRFSQGSGGSSPLTGTNYEAKTLKDILSLELFLRYQRIDPFPAMNIRSL